VHSSMIWNVVTFSVSHSTTLLLNGLFSNTLIIFSVVTLKSYPQWKWKFAELFPFLKQTLSHDMTWYTSSVDCLCKNVKSTVIFLMLFADVFATSLASDSCCVCWTQPSVLRAAIDLIVWFFITIHIYTAALLFLEWRRY